MSESIKVGDVVRLKARGFLDSDNSDLYDVTGIGLVLLGRCDLTIRNRSTRVETTVSDTDVIKVEGI